MPRTTPYNDNEQSNVMESITHLFLEVERLRVERDRLQQEVLIARERADGYQRQVEQIRSFLEKPPKNEGATTDERREASAPRRMRFVSRAKKRMDKCPKPEGIFTRLHSTNVAESSIRRESDTHKKQ